MSADQFDTAVTAGAGILGALIGAGVGGWFTYRASIDSADRAFQHQLAAARRDRVSAQAMHLAALLSEVHVDAMKEVTNVDTVRRLTDSWSLTAAFSASDSPHLSSELQRGAALARVAFRRATEGDWKDLIDLLVGAGVLLAHWQRDPEKFETDRPTLESMEQFRPKPLA